MYFWQHVQDHPGHGTYTIYKAEEFNRLVQKGLPAAGWNLYNETELKASGLQHYLTRARCQSYIADALAGGKSYGTIRYSGSPIQVSVTLNDPPSAEYEVYYSDTVYYYHFKWGF
jgi:hypothetical protein